MSKAAAAAFSTGINAISVDRSAKIRVEVATLGINDRENMAPA